MDKALPFILLSTILIMLPVLVFIFFTTVYSNVKEFDKIGTFAVNYVNNHNQIKIIDIDKEIRSVNRNPRTVKIYTVEASDGCKTTVNPGNFIPEVGEVYTIKVGNINYYSESAIYLKSKVK